MRMDTGFTCWPSLEAYAKLFPSKRFPGLFYYDYSLSEKIDKPILILIHGLGDEADSWRHIIPLLGRGGYRVLALDLPGFGRSTVPCRSSMANNRDAVIELVKSVSENSAQRFVLIGSSMGATIAEAAILAMDALGDNPINSLVLLDGCIPMEPAGSPAIILTVLPVSGKRWYRSFRSNPEKAWQSLFSYYADIHSLSQKDQDFLRKRVMDRVCSTSQERAYFSSLRSLIFQSMRSSYYRRIGSWPGKIALVWGEKDMIMPRAVADSFVKLRGNNNTTLSVIPGAGHLPHQEKPAETAKAILEIINEK
jgi:pimeloyl-ACP methyl ester carboxylesterase